MAQTAVRQIEINKQANKSSERSSTVEKKKTKIIRKLRKVLVGALVLTVILGSVFAGAVFFGLVNPSQVASELGLSKYPIIGQLLKQPSIEQLQDSDDSFSDGPSIPKPPSPPPIRAEIPKTSVTNAPLQVDDTELKKQAALKLEAEQKRLAKVSRLYDGMKAEEAAPILNELDDETVILIFSKMDEERVAKIMTLLDPSRSARLSNAMLKGRVIGQPF